MKTIGFVSYGLGYIGRLITKVAIERGLVPLGAIDTDPSMVGKDLADILHCNAARGITVSMDPTQVLARTKPTIIFHATGSFLDRVSDQILLCIDAGSNVLSTCETLSYPYHRFPSLAEEIDVRARERGVAVLGTGINPGFIMDALPSVMTACMSRLDSIMITRSLDALRRRLSFQMKIGLGLSLDAFERKLSRGELTAHVGYAESVLLMSSILHLPIDEVNEEQRPLLAERDIELPNGSLKRNTVSGVAGRGVGIRSGREVIILQFRAAAGLKEYEEVRLTGDPVVRWRSKGTSGDIATASIMLNMVSPLLHARSGLLTMKDFINISFAGPWGGSASKREA